MYMCIHFKKFWELKILNLIILKILKGILVRWSLLIQYKTWIIFI